MKDASLRLKRLKIRSWRRGTKEMDLLFGHYADAYLEKMHEGDLDAFEALLAEEDPAITAWVMGVEPTPEHHQDMLERLKTHIKSLQV